MRSIDTLTIRQRAQFSGTPQRRHMDRPNTSFSGRAAGRMVGQVDRRPAVSPRLRCARMETALGLAAGVTREGSATLSRSLADVIRPNGRSSRCRDLTSTIRNGKAARLTATTGRKKLRIQPDGHSVGWPGKQRYCKHSCPSRSRVDTDGNAGGLKEKARRL